MKEIFNTELINEFLTTSRTWIINVLPGIIVTIIVFIFALKTINFFLKKLRKFMLHRAEIDEDIDTDEASKRIRTLINIIHGLFRVILWSVFFMVLMPKFGINIAPVLAGAGILGLAIGFGAQELVRDFISGFFIILENQIRAGDVGIINGKGGLVEKIELRTTTLRDFSGVVHIFQNGKINELSNMTKQWSAIVLDIGVAYKEDVEKVIAIMKQVGDELKQDPSFGHLILEPIEVFGLDKFADSALVIKARIKTKPIQQWGVGREYRKRLKIAFDENGIEIPFPHTTVYWGEAIKPLKIQENSENQKQEN